MSAYAASQVRELLARGPQEDEDFYRLQVQGNGSTNWVNVTPDELAAIAQVVDGIEDPSTDPLQLAEQIADLARRVTPHDEHPSSRVSVVPIKDANYTHALRVGDHETFVGWLSDVTAMATNVGDALAEADNEPAHPDHCHSDDADDIPAWRRNLISAAWAGLDATDGDSDAVRDQSENAIGAWTP